MEILDNVYKTFSSLDKDYKRSKKSRRDFIIDRFCGDIQIGSMIILDCCRVDCDDNNPDDIEKFSFIKNTIERLRQNEKYLDHMSSFLEDNSQPCNNFIKLLYGELARSNGATIVEQDELHRKKGKPFHYVVTKDGVVAAAPNKCDVISCFNVNNALFLKYHLATARNVKPDVGDFFLREAPMMYRPCTKTEAEKALKK